MNPTEATILVVDDDTALREAIVFILERSKFKVMAAANGTQALQIVMENKIHLVLSDIRMPGGNGIELLQKLRKIDPEIPIVIFVSGFSDISDVDAIAMGAYQVFTKPFNRIDLIATINNCLHGLNEAV